MLRTLGPSHHKYTKCIKRDCICTKLRNINIIIIGVITIVIVDDICMCIIIRTLDNVNASTNTDARINISIDNMVVLKNSNRNCSQYQH